MAAIPAGTPTRYGKTLLHHDGIVAPAAPIAVLTAIAIPLTDVPIHITLLKNRGVSAFHLLLIISNHLNISSYCFLTKLLSSFMSFKWVTLDRKSTRLNSSHANISYAVFCLKKNHPRHLRDPLLRAARPRRRPLP